MTKQPRVRAVDFKAGKPTRWQAFDTFEFTVSKDASQRKITREGFLIVPAFISKAGNVQEYTARELGIEGTNRTIRLFRPKDEVFKPESYSTFERQTLTNSHPDNDVTASTYRQVTSGDVHDVAPAADDVHLGANLYCKDANTIEMVVTYDKNQLSCGYSFVLDMTAGTTPEGEAYDGVMRDIVGNHVAIVWQARGGPGLRVADKKPNQEKRIMRTVTIDGTTVNFEDDNQGAMVELALKRAADAIKTANDATTKAQEEATAAKNALKAATDASAAAAATHATEKAALQAQVVTGDALDTLVEAKSKAVDGAKLIVGDSFDGKGKTVEAIRVEALEHVAKDAAAYPGVIVVLGGKAPKEAPAEIAALAFDAAVAVKTAAGAGGGEPRKGANDAAAKAFAPGKDGKGGGDSSGARVIDYKARHGRKSGGESASQQ